MFVTLSEEQGRIAREVSTNGVAETTVDRLMPSRHAYDAIRDVALSFADSQRIKDCYAAFLRNEKRETLKQFLVKYQDIQRFDPKHPLFRFGLHSAIYDTACACLFRTLVYYSADLWCILPDAQTHVREWSQNWHRDPEADRLIKVFLFIEDVTADAGPFEYVTGSHNHGYPEACPPRCYAGDQQAIASLPKESKRCFIRPAGTIVFSDTSGLHRGGYTTSKRRLSCVWTYLPEGKPKFTLESIPLDLTSIQRASLCLN